MPPKMPRQFKKKTDKMINIQIPIEQFKIQSINQINKSLIKKELSINDLNFKLSWLIRNQLIIILNDFSASLFGNLGDKIVQKINYLIQNLINLPLKLDELFINNIKDSHILIINSKLRNSLIEQLIKNQNGIIYCDLINDESKLEIMKENNEMVYKLLNLPVEFLNLNYVNLKEQKMFSNTTNNQLEYEDVSNFQLMTKTEFDKQLNRFENEIRNMRIELEKLTINNQTSCVAFTFKLKKVKKFMKKDALYRSKMFICQDINWYIKCESVFIDNERYLSIYLCSINNLNIKSNSKLKAKFEFRILSQMPLVNSKMKQMDYLFTKSESAGILKFISTKELFDKKNVFVKNDLILIQLCLSVQLVHKSDQNDL